ncbi:MAG: hypothetical protein OIF55_17820, partial [Amphritea sp.]|nr:hypothetical protein [Amphritea sp.]
TRIHKQPGQQITDTRMVALPFQPHYQPRMKYGQVRQQVMIAWHNELSGNQQYVYLRSMERSGGLMSLCEFGGVCC